MKKLVLEDYEVVLGDVENSLPPLVKKLNPSAIIIIVDENTKKHCLPRVFALLPHAHIITIKSGEVNKNLVTCQHIWTSLIEGNFDRNVLVIDLGGGVIGDMGGFCASTYKRGVNFIQIPTTLLSQVDASVGGKLGIDFKTLKNIIGVFQNPKAVLVDPRFLDTLSEREKRSGFAEILKHALIYDKKHWEKVSQVTNVNDLENIDEIILHSIAIKKEVVEQDFKEGGLRKILNFGHTIGHAIESYALGTENHLLHGEAIAIGMITEAYLSFKLGNLNEKELEEIKTVLLKIYGKVDLSFLNEKVVLASMLNDKKNIGTTISFSLLAKIGEATFDDEVPSEWIQESLKYYNK